MPMPLDTCSNCGRRFKPWQVAEERLLQAIFGQRPLCKKCAKEGKYPKCTICGKPTTANLYFNGNPYCPEHLPYSE